MFGHARLVALTSFLALIGPALSANLYRMTFDSPENAKRDGGLIAKVPNGDATVIEHVQAKPGIKDPWISTSSSKKFCASGAKSPGGLNCYVYTIDPKANSLTIKDAKKAFEDAKMEYPNPAEKEFSVKNKIPWTSIIEWDIYRGGKKQETVTRADFERPKTPPAAAPASPKTPPPASNKRPASQSPKGSSPKKNNKRSVRVRRAFTA
ncbi:hypothetical protein RB595_004943 [Gaeumannomyces hyphopodioides]